MIDQREIGRRLEANDAGSFALSSSDHILEAKASTNRRDGIDVPAILREASKPSHEALERRIDFDFWFADIARYTELIGLFYGFYSPVTAALASFPELPRLVPGFDLRNAQARLWRDLSYLNVVPERLPQCQIVPEINSLEAAFGVLYVFEGATLGGQVICQILRRQLGVTPEQGCAFFSGYGASTGAMWKSFLRALSANLITQPEVSSAVRAATQTFRCLDGWLLQGIVAPEPNGQRPGPRQTGFPQSDSLPPRSR